MEVLALLNDPTTRSQLITAGFDHPFSSLVTPPFRLRSLQSSVSSEPQNDEPSSVEPTTVNQPQKPSIWRRLWKDSKTSVGHVVYCKLGYWWALSGSKCECDGR
jgi:hypothetical protein